MALQEILPKRAGHRYGDHYYIAVSSARNDKGTQNCITLSKNAMQDMRWLIGLGYAEPAAQGHAMGYRLTPDGHKVAMARRGHEQS